MMRTTGASPFKVVSPFVLDDALAQRNVLSGVERAKDDSRMPEIGQAVFQIVLKIEVRIL